MRSMLHTNRLWVFSTVAVLALGCGAAGEQGAGRVVQLPDEDRAVLEQYLGRGVVGKAIEAKTISDPLKFIPAKDTTSSYRVTEKSRKGRAVKHVVERLQRDASGSSIKLKVDDTDVLFFRRGADDNIGLVSHQELDHGLNVSYSPPDPMVLKGMNPGDTHEIRFNMKIYDLNEPNQLKHAGSLDVTLCYVGAYEVATGAGQYDAILIKSTYKGRIGPAHVDDTQYRFIVEDVGIVAMIEKKDVSALLLYKDHVKVGKVLVELK